MDKEIQDNILDHSISALRTLRVLDDDDIFWYRDDMHTPYPVTPLGMTTIQKHHAWGFHVGAETAMAPSRGAHVKIYKGKVYLGFELIHDPVELAERKKRNEEFITYCKDNWDEFYRNFINEVKEGLENLAGIPGSLGGLVYMNGGAYGTEVFDCITEVEIVDEKNEIKTLKKEEIHFTYRKTEIQEKKWTVVSTTFKFENGFDREKVEELKGKRGNNHPLDLPNLGSTFKNPEGHYSARLIIEAGMQGKKIGGAQISMVHPNFIVNHGDAKSEDIKELIRQVKEKVKKTCGIDLEEEIIVVGE